MATVCVLVKKDMLDRHPHAGRSVLSAQIVLNTKLVFIKSAKIHVQGHAVLMLDAKSQIIIRSAHAKLDLRATHS